MKNIQIILFIAILLGSCSKRENLTPKEIKFNPYSIGDVLIFSSTKGEIDTFRITEIKFLYNDAPIVLKEYYQSMRVWEGSTPKGEVMDRRRLILNINSGGAEKPTFVEFFDFNGHKILLKDLLTMEKVLLSTPIGTFNDVIHLVKETENRSKFDNSQVYWSLSNGLLKFETGESETWTLIEKK